MMIYNGGPKNLLSIPRWKKYLVAVKQLEEKGYIGSETIKEGDKFACGIIKGTYADVAAFEDDYYVNVIQNPQATSENVYEGMFAVSKYTKSLSRSMEIITYLNTRSDLRNLFAYGIEGVNYELDKEGVSQEAQQRLQHEARVHGQYVRRLPAGMQHSRRLEER